MKTRNGFVSNSSSSSFICQVCGEEASGMDLSMSDAGMCKCYNDHVFCESHQREIGNVISTEEKRNKIIAYYKAIKTDDKYWTLDEINRIVSDIQKMTKKEVENRYDDFVLDQGIDSRYCPICMFESPLDTQLFTYLVKKSGKTPKDIMELAKSEFETYENFLLYLRSN